MRQKLDKVIDELYETFRPRWKERGLKFMYLWYSAGPLMLRGNQMRITVEQQLTGTIVPKTRLGQIAQIDGDVEFSSSDPSVCTVEATGPMSVKVTPVAPGVCQVFAAFDADLGEGVRPVEMSDAIEVVAAEAVTGTITWDPPTDMQPPA